MAKLISATIRIVTLTGLACLLLGGEAQADNHLRVDHLRCEYRVDPTGMDIRSPRLSWKLVSSGRGQKQSAYQVLVAGSRAALDAKAGDRWDSGKINSDQSIHIVYEGQPLTSRTQCFWKVRVWDESGKRTNWSPPAQWTMGLLDPSDWQAQWIAMPAGDVEQSTEQEAALPYLRKTFTIPGQLQRATVYVTGLGLYELRINGERVGDHLLAPEWTMYGQRVQYQTLDVTDLVQPGENAIGVILAKGWHGDDPFFAAPPPADRAFAAQLALICQLEVEMADGTTQTIVSDPTWHGTQDGPLRNSNIYQGETYDARRELSAWDTAGFDDPSWQPARVVDFSDANLIWQRNEPIRKFQELQPVKVMEPEPGVYVFDLGQNLVGWCRLRAHGAQGDEIVLRHAEHVRDDGTIYITNLSEAAQTDRWILAGQDGAETFEPHFTYHGFRYVEVTGLSQQPSLTDLVGVAFHSDVPTSGQFECSSELVNQLMRNIVWTQRNNLYGFPTDCPQRNERAGWMGDMQAFCQTAIYNCDMAAFFSKWIIDIRDSQSPEGRYAEIAPMPKQPAIGAPAWSDGGTIVPWRMYENYGDTRLLREHFDSARRWVDFVHQKNPDFIWRYDRGGDFGDWLNGDHIDVAGWQRTGAEVPKELMATAFFARSTAIVANMARVLGDEQNAKKYQNLLDQIQAAFLQEFVTDDDHLVGDTQAGYALALRFDLLPPPLHSPAVAHLLAGIDRYHGHLSTGIQTSHRAMLELTRNGHHDKACQIMLLREPPSWGYMIDSGATTMWERWDGYVKERGETLDQQLEVGSPVVGMNSFNHYAMGSVGEWVWRHIAGISPDLDQPGYKHVIIHPRPGPGLNWARARYDSIYGPIETDWRLEDNRFRLKTTIPPNTTATVYVPARDADNISEGGEPTSKAESVESLGIKDGEAIFHVDSGTYEFAASTQ
jgi:alpha-L-rhamnosidase